MSGPGILPLGLAQLAQIGLLLFFLAVFVGLLVSMFRPGAREAAREAASIPFSDDGKDGR
ncbi:cbb3-type cytochrome c oxidase subunit 3 [Teichococcus rhizosphaerae]|uniref:cbb3-type cytochrome c oxidase subunit 3 n=1 Tax=Teichococcus rhizosphaerae TaxID=1335062 RepID=UPI001C3F326D|nr:cbb3-type cytochrome c oxidase subunit 3 [Pseudoroseomonas rhizosphaerae]